VHRSVGAAACLALLALAATTPAARADSPPEPVLVDGFETSSAWTAMPASGVTMRLSVEPGVHGNALRVDFDFGRGGGYAVLHRAVSLDLPENYVFRYRLRGATAPQNLEFKLLDGTGENVWWWNRPDFTFPSEWSEDRVRRRNIGFAWGPRGGGTLRHAAALEFAITAGSGGRGTVWLDDLEWVELPVPGPPPPPRARATSEAPAHPAAAALDSLPGTWWECAAGDRAPALTLELGTLREFGGLVIDWAEGRRAPDHDVEAQEGDGAWRTLRRVRGGRGSRDWLRLPESEATAIRVRVVGGHHEPVGIAAVELQPLEWGATDERFLAAVARGSPRGHYPRGFLGEQSYWTVVGVDGAREEGLIDEDGRVEVGRGAFSLEPFVRADSRLRSWASDAGVAFLEPGRFPLPTVERRAPGLTLAVTAFARGPVDASQLVVRYRVRNRSPESRRVALVVAVRPFQVNPPSQFLNVPGGPARIASLRHEGATVWVNGDRPLVFDPPPDRFTAAAFDAGDFVAALEADAVPQADSLRDPVGRASGALTWTLDLDAGGEEEVVALIPLVPGNSAPRPLAAGDAAAAMAAAERDGASRLGSLRLEAGGGGDEIAATLAAQLGYVLVNRDGPAIQPGSRAYERSWIRDGALTSSALLHAGMSEPVREYLEWYATHQYVDGKVPCCVDRRGADPVPEHDSHGEFIFLAAEYLRLTGDRATVARLWPHVRAAAAYLDTLRAQRRTAEWRTPENRRVFGLLPPSISHEGYSAKPMHSFWDDLFAVRGYRDATWLAATLGERDDLGALERSRDEFEADFAAAVRATMADHGIDFVPGCADLGDFDATSTTIALSPVQATGVLPESALVRTFERYWAFFERRRDGREAWDAYTPYELRNVGAFVRLGWRGRAEQALTWFLHDRRPPGWRQWAEVVGRDPRHARFVGDMPHTWVGSDFVRSVQEMLAYEREPDSTLVLAAGVPADWIEGDGVRVGGLHTRWGVVAYTLRRERQRLVLALDAAALRVPPGGLEFAPPLALADGTPTTAERVRVDGRPARAERDGRVRWRPARGGTPARLTLEWALRPVRPATDGRGPR